MSFFTIHHYNERNERLSPRQVLAEDYETLSAQVRHDDCGGFVEIIEVGTSREAHCRKCDARWRETFGDAGWVRLEIYGGEGL